MVFYLGTHKPHWLSFSDVPLFVSARRMREYRTPPEARCPWALDSGGFTELSLFGRWQTPARQYADEARRWEPDWAAIQDWMCEPEMLGKTGLTIKEHQQKTIASYHQLRDLAPDVNWVPVLQGWEWDDYMAHVEAYRESGVDLSQLERVGLGSVCRRQDTALAEQLVRDLHRIGIRVHAFGFKLNGLRRCAPWLASSDSMAWSLDARRAPPLPGHTHKSCANCWEYARQWYEKVFRLTAPREVQPLLW